MDNNIMYLVKDELELVNCELEKISINHRISNDLLKSFVSGPSKRIRTLVSSLYIKANEKKVSENCIKIMSAGEIIHNASLLHDDVIDEAETRRNKITVGKEYSPQVSILLGDYLLAYATDILLKIDNTIITDKFFQCTKDMCLAELNQYFLRGKVPSIEEYIEICRGKTGKLFEAIIESCANEINLEHQASSEFSKNFGILFQLKNDLKSVSAELDNKNKIFTPKDFLGIEKTNILLNNYMEKLEESISKLPDNEYKKGLGVLLSSL